MACQHRAGHRGGESIKNPGRTGLNGLLPSQGSPPHYLNRLPGLRYSWAAGTFPAPACDDLATAAVCVEPLDFDAVGLAFLAVRLPPYPSSPLLDRTKSEIRGAISARKRDPLNTP